MFGGQELSSELTLTYSTVSTDPASHWLRCSCAPTAATHAQSAVRWRVDDYGLQLIRRFQGDCMYLDGEHICLSVGLFGLLLQGL